VTAIEDVHRELREGFAAINERLDIQNGSIRTLELWRARMEGARLFTVGLWQSLGTAAAVIAAGVAVYIAITG
jgi:hypothetical protein